jgi:transketolase
MTRRLTSAAPGADESGHDAATTLMLAERALSVKRRLLAMCQQARAIHVGSSLSCAEILVFLQFAWMRADDRLVLSKGHAAATLYSLLAETQVLSDQQIASFYRDDTELPALPSFHLAPHIPFATGSLGHGLSLCAGMTLGARLNQQPRRFFCVTSDGELDEGSVWEAALFIAHHRLTNLIWIVDRNQLQAIGRTEDVLALEPLDAKLRAFGFHVITLDGHDFTSWLAAREECAAVWAARPQPVAIIASTIKGRGLGSLQDRVDSHYGPLSEAHYAEAFAELEREQALLSNGYRHAR